MARTVSAAAPPVRTDPAPERPRDPIAELRFLHELLGLATTAQTWEELLETVVDGTRDALGASVSSFYLLDRDGTRLTLAATNGLDRFQIGRAVVPFGEGITGRVAAIREPMVIPDVAADPRFLWVRGIDQRRFVASMLSVPLMWHDQVVGVLNVQTETHRDFAESDVDQLSAIADLLAGIVEKGRLQREAEAQVEQLKALDQARNELIALVTHELRTPLAVVRAYTDLLSDEPLLESAIVARPRPSRAARLVAPRRPSTRSSASTAWWTRSWRPCASSRTGRRTSRPIDMAAARRRAAQATSVRCSRATSPGSAGSRKLHALADPAPPSTGARAPARERREVRPAGHHVEIDWRLDEGSCRSRSPTRGRASRQEWRDRIFEPYARHETATARGSGIGLYAARRLAESMGGQLWCEPAPSGGARFVVALPAAVAV